jgi:hypothetical protein
MVSTPSRRRLASHLGDLAALADLVGVSLF